MTPSKTMGNAEWRFYEAARELRLPDVLRVAPRRMLYGKGAGVGRTSGIVLW